MKVWHLERDTARFPAHPSAGENVSLVIGSWPVEPGQRIWVDWRVGRADDPGVSSRSEGTWDRNAGGSSYWHVNLGPFADGERVAYTVRGEASEGPAGAGTFAFEVRPKIHLALLWHQHQPLYRDPARRRARPFLRFPWVRLHALRDYYGMAQLLEEAPEVHATINLTPALLTQIEDYTERGATDRALELTRTPAEQLGPGDVEELLSGFFDAAWHTQIYPWARYRELLERRRLGESFETRDLRDLQMWFNLAWFAPELQRGRTQLATGEAVSVEPFVEKGRDFTHAEIEAMVEAQLAVLRGVVPLHRRLEERGQIELSTTPFYHPILPLVFDSDRGTLDREGTALPHRFARPADAVEHVSRAQRFHAERLGRAPRGLWPAEGAVGQSIVGLLADARVEWIATDRGVLERSGRFGYEAGDPNVLCQAYRAEDAQGRGVAVFFRDTALANRIGFDYGGWADPEQAAHDLVREIKERFAWRVDAPRDRVLAIALDGENAWGGYAEQGRPFLRALYRALATDPEIRTVTFGEYLAGDVARGVASHPCETLARVHELFHGSWADESGSAPGVDLGTWIGEPEENEGWDRLREAGDLLDSIGASPESHPEAFEALYGAEGSDWFWWLGTDQSSDADADFEELFRACLRRVYHAAGRRPPRRLDRPIGAYVRSFSFARPLACVQPGDRLAFDTNCAGHVEWRTQRRTVWARAGLAPTGGVMAGVQRHRATLGPFDVDDAWVELRFVCGHPGCDGHGPCCRGEPQRVQVRDEAYASPRRADRAPATR